MINSMIERLRLAIKDSETAGPKFGVVLSQTDAKQLLYRLLKEAKNG